MTILQHAPVILASGSAVRQQMLKSVGLTFSVEPSGVDEEALTATLTALSLPERALALARAKAVAVGQQHADAYTIGADQICALGERVLNKPLTYENATAQLSLLSGKTHRQHCGLVLLHGDHIIWEHVGIAELTMRTLSPADIQAYIATDAPLAACGSYKFESLGRHLFAEVKGDHDVIQGLPLVALLARMHALGIISLS
ncbi:MAG: Maf family protein [Alphaproteobacteria bacterium]